MTFRLRLVPVLVAALVALPVTAGFLGTLLPAFGYLPALGADALSLQPFHELFATPGIGRSGLLSVWTGLAATALSVLLAMLALAAFVGTRALTRVERMLAPLLAVPHAAAAFGVALLIPPSGLLFRLAAVPLGLGRPPDLLIVGDPLGLSLILGLVAKEMPFILLVALASLPRAEPARRTAVARSLGQGRAAAFLFAVWPTLYREIRLPVLAVAAFGSSVVDVSLILGPSTPPTLAVQLLRWMGDPDLGLRLKASAGALLQGGATLAAILLWLGVERCAAAWLRRRLARGGRLPFEAAMRGLGLGAALLPVIVVGLGLVGLALWSVAGFWSFPDLLPPSLSGRTWSAALRSAAGPLGTTLALGLLSAGAAVLLAILLLAAASPLPRRLAALLALPLLVPQPAFVFGLSTGLLALGGRPSLLVLSALHLVFVLPYVLLALAEPWARLDPRFERVAASLGRGRFARLLRVRLPLLLKPLLSAFAIGFAVSAGLYLPTIVLGAGLYPTITTEAVALASGGDRRIIGAYALLQAALPCLAFALVPAIHGLCFPGRRGMRT
ncbi:ABC transporter permease [Antarcticirhabdus aurantiaca]|uniref:ABC transporter permease n=1 Tax=Antarcticirhabdus aurantiaca TaxID=2606717 RepID=A0ACD4NPZ1_9HYPH|nr:ABC transporter permease [Antarcticirhabdus aurantiaca]WAJ28986.1 ABC transporter permease [Jeongeuplla avenae]